MFIMKQVKTLITTYCTILLAFVLQKPLFLIIQQAMCPSQQCGFWSNISAVVWHGLTLDISMAGYLSIVPCLTMIASIWVNGKIAQRILNGYFWVAAALIACSFVLNMALYPFWNYPLDSTPLFYFFTSPADAFASTSVWFSAFGILLAAILTVAIWYALRTKQRLWTCHRIGTLAAMIISAAAMFLAIRGGLTVSTANTGKAYYSQNAFLNHAAVNPLFSLMESLSHQEDFGTQYRYMPDEKATKTFEAMISQSDDDTTPLLSPEAIANGAPDILIVIMESFANDLLPSIGTQGDVAVNLDSIAQSSISFTRFFANSFRTDRGLVSILSGYPAQPTHSIMKYPAKSAHLPSLARSLAEAKHYTSTYFYGGDVDFANQRSWLVSQGYQHIISDADFPIKDKLSKWGVPDHIVAQRLLADIKSPSSKAPHLRVFQTSSSHEPFDVPYKRLADKRLNAFAYTDSVIGNLMRQYAQLPSWRNTLVVLVPDHVGAYTEHLDNFTRKRYEIPLIITGGAIARPMKIDAIGSQHDIAATLLGQLGIKHNDFTFSKNLLSKSTPKFAFFTVPDAFGIVTDSAAVIFDNKMKQAVFTQGGDTKQCTECGKAYLQKLYDNLDKL